jgi:hypothetical protein
MARKQGLMMDVKKLGVQVGIVVMGVIAAALIVNYGRKNDISFLIDAHEGFDG